MGKVRGGVSVVALREIKLLKEFQQLPHPNLIALLDVFAHDGALHLVFELCSTDLEVIIQDTNTPLTPGDIKTYMQHVLRAVAHCHANWILHRDLKPNNLLMGLDHELKLADFGAAKEYASPERRYHNVVVTRWYRPPELLFGSREYGVGVDMWSIGCIFAELLLRRPFFPGTSELDQLGKIFHVFGTPTESEWPGLTSLPSYIGFTPCRGTPLPSIFRSATANALDLLSQFLAFEPSKRICATEALMHPYFSDKPLPTEPRLLAAVKKQEKGGEML
jgi:cyclin-dependent kinase 7